jgi:hypothetical protein
MATNIDPDDIPPASSTQIENLYGVVRSTPYDKRAVHNVPLSHLPMKNMFNFASANAAAPANSTAKFYDIGNFYICTFNQPNTSVIGELWVEYDLTLIRRKQPGPVGFANKYLHLSEYPAATGSSAFPGGTAGFAAYAGSASNIAYTATSTVVTILEAGRYVVSFCGTAGTGNFAGAASYLIGAGVTLVPFFNDELNTNITSFTAAFTNIVSVIDVSTANNAAATLTFTGGTVATTQRNDIIINQIASGSFFSPEHIVRRPVAPLQTITDAMQRLLDTEQRL